MKKQFSYLFVVTATVLLVQETSQLLAGPGSETEVQADPKTIIVTCTGANAVCSPVMNAVGEVVEINPTRIKFNLLGKITETEPVTVRLPQEPGQRSAYKFIPTTGLAAGRTINVVLENVEQPVGTRKADLSVINVYTQRQGQPADKWTTVAELTNVFAPRATVSLKADGIVTVRDPRTKRPVTINLAAQARTDRVRGD